MTVEYPTNEQMQESINAKLAYDHTIRARATAQHVYRALADAMAFADDMARRVRNPVIQADPNLAAFIDGITAHYMDDLMPLWAKMNTPGTNGQSVAQMMAWEPDLSASYVVTAEEQAVFDAQAAVDLAQAALSLAATADPFDQAAFDAAQLAMMEAQAALAALTIPTEPTV